MSTETTSTLTSADRCDRCGAQAYVRVQLDAGELYFCAHHARDHVPALQQIALDIVDESHRLNEPEQTPTPVS